MTKLVVMLLVCVILAGATIYALGRQVIPATGTAGTTQRTNIQTAFN
ncbi:hypothetical protein PAECIP111802_04935 [Paenibacillus allorhizosphaerae]|uniref:Uncharacterized protein n=1 Tax=Paenibacillus allorhizosphaerae TaxID=2849866 RepID=A0ABN7TTJ3_9BACL|nr:hypothetical protein PAECIP111802_04935 [Paenibacillus allorhizosphaerae]